MLWEGAGLQAVETREIVVQRRFESFEAFWEIARSTAATRGLIEKMTPEQAERLENGVRARMVTDDAGCVIHTARANAVRGLVPA